MKKSNKPVSTWNNLAAQAARRASMMGASGKAEDVSNKKIQLTDLSKVLPDTQGAILLDTNLEEAV